MSTIYFAGGCFWGLEHYMKQIKGVLDTDVGYANGHTANPTYEEVCTGSTMHAETVRVKYDPAVLPLSFLLELFFQAINPTTLNRQGADEGTQYRSGIFFEDEADAPVIRTALEGLQARYERPIVVEEGKLTNYSSAEDYHQDYLSNRAGGYCHISPQRMSLAAKARVNPALYPRPDEAMLQAKLKPEAYQITQHAGTEPPFSHPYEQNEAPGIYVDITTGEPLFSSREKYHSGSGWPSFTAPIDPFVLTCKEDSSHGMQRTEVKSRAGNAHLGHVFEDGPRERGGQRYCINGAALQFIPQARMEAEGYGYLLDLV